MELKNIMLGVVIILAISATLTMINARSTGQATYQQMVHRDYMVRVPNYDPCTTAKCTLNAAAIAVGQDLAGNIVCECPDGKIYLVDAQRRY
jgi:hypothetical protein